MSVVLEHLREVAGKDAQEIVRLLEEHEKRMASELIAVPREVLHWLIEAQCLAKGMNTEMAKRHADATVEAFTPVAALREG